MANELTREELNDLMKKGWSYRIDPQGAAVSTDILVDPVTLKRYKLHVNNGKLTMTEVTE